MEDLGLPYRFVLSVFFQICPRSDSVAVKLFRSGYHLSRFCWGKLDPANDKWYNCTDQDLKWKKSSLEKLFKSNPSPTCRLGQHMPPTRIARTEKIHMHMGAATHD
jgi:hypothetical protein